MAPHATVRHAPLLITAASASHTCDLRIAAGQPGERGQAVGKGDDVHSVTIPAAGSLRCFAVASVPAASTSSKVFAKWRTCSVSIGWA